jgi:hypothetical protein
MKLKWLKNGTPSKLIGVNISGWRWVVGRFWCVVDSWGERGRRLGLSPRSSFVGEMN